jgi:hypothetical protein
MNSDTAIPERNTTFGSAPAKCLSRMKEWIAPDDYALHDTQRTVYCAAFKPDYSAPLETRSFPTLRRNTPWQQTDPAG